MGNKSAANLDVFVLQAEEHKPIVSIFNHQLQF
jgi:hypothetical protein